MTMLEPSQGKKHSGENDAEEGQTRLHLPLRFLWRPRKAMACEQADALSIAQASVARELGGAEDHLCSHQKKRCLSLSV
jgi:hypothetical protein